MFGLSCKKQIYLLNLSSLEGYFDTVSLYVAGQAEYRVVLMNSTRQLDINHTILLLCAVIMVAGVEIKCSLGHWKHRG